jgi:hypothetical protein
MGEMNDLWMDGFMDDEGEQDLRISEFEEDDICLET